MAEKQKSKQRMGKANGRWKGGVSSDYQRRITKAKKNELVHHKDHNRKHNSKSNLKKLKAGNGMTAKGKHNVAHPERNKK